MIHVLFSSAAGTLRQVLAARGQEARIVHFTETLDWGPIATSNFEDREAWLDLHMPNDFGGWDWIAESISNFRNRIAEDVERLLWISPRSAQELSGLYWYLSEFGGDGSQMIIADYVFQGTWRDEPPLSLSQLQQHQIAEILDACPRAIWNSSQFPEGLWHKLQAEDALLRIVDDGVLQSAPADYFDQFLLDRCPADWAKIPRVVAHAMGDMSEAGHDPDSTMLFWRVRELIQSGLIACDGALPAWPGSIGDAAKIRRVDI